MAGVWQLRVYPFDTDPGRSFIVDIFSGVPGAGASGTVADGQDESFLYQPNVNFNGTDSFSYSMVDNMGGTDTGLVSVTIADVNDAPVAQNDTATTQRGVAVVIDVTANDSDVDGNLEPGSVVHRLRQLQAQPRTTTTGPSPIHRT